MKRYLLFIIAVFFLSSAATAQETKKSKKSQKTEVPDSATIAKQAKAKADKALSQAKENLKRGQNLENVEKQMRELLADPYNAKNDKIWLTLFQSVKKQYEQVNEKIYLKQQADSAKLYNCTLRMFYVLESLDSIDCGLDIGQEKKGIYRSSHSKYLSRYRANLFAGGMYFAGKKDYTSAYNCFDCYLDCAAQPLFARYDYAKSDPLMPEAAFWASYAAFKLNAPDLVLKHEATAMKCKEYNEQLLQYLAASYQMKGNTERYIELLTDGFERYPMSQYFFPLLVRYYALDGQHEKAIALSDQMLFIQPTNMAALMTKCYSLLYLEKYEECVAATDAIITLDESVAIAYLYAGMSYYNQALVLADQAYTGSSESGKLKLLYTRALPYFEKYRQLEPEAKDQWAEPLYNIYYTLNKGEEFEEIEQLLEAQ